MAERARYNIPNTSFPGITTTEVQFTLTVNESPFDLTDSVISLQIRMSSTTPAVDTLSSDAAIDADQRIEIIDAEAGTFNVKAFKFKAGIPPATYKYDIKITLPDTIAVVYVYGDWVVGELITQV